MRKLVLAGHGNIAEGLKSSASLIVGAMADSIITYALNPGGSATDFCCRSKCNNRKGTRN